MDWLAGNAGGLHEDIPLPPGISINPDETEDIAIQGPPKDPAMILWEEHTSSALTEEFIDTYRKNMVKRPIFPFT
jgi:hypothetical protein